MANEGGRVADQRTVHEGWLVVVNDYQWVGNPLLGAFRIYADGKQAGVALPGGDDLNVPVEPGQHTLRVRLWYYLSPRVDVNVQPGETLRFHADIPRTLPLWRRMTRALVHPFHSLALARDNQSSVS